MPKLLRHCSTCGVPVLRYRSQMKAQVFCSQECAWTAQRTDMGPFSKPCPTCGQSIVEQYRSGLAERRYCSRKCAAAVRRKPDVESQWCASCKLVKPVTEFRRNARRTSGRSAYCKTCRRGEKQGDPCKRYRMDPVEFAELLQRQGGVCAICGMPESSRPRLCVDHDHATDTVRGLLCNRCNTAIGLMKDNPERLTRAAAYLTEASWTTRDGPSLR